MNTKRRDALTKEFIEENYVDENGYLMVKELQRFLKCKSTTTVFNTCRRFKVNFKDRKTNNHLNQINLQKLSKSFIEKNFLDKNGYVLVQKFMNFINCKSVKIFKLCKVYNVKYKISTHQNINQNSLSKINKEFIEENFIDKDNYIKVKEFMNYLNCYNENMIYKLCRKYSVNFTVRIPNQAHLNQDNLKILTKDYIEKHFLEKTGFVNIMAFKLFLGCKDNSTVHKYCKKFNLDYDRKSSFDYTKSAILYYLKDIITGLYKIGITNRNVETRFGPAKLKEIKILQVIKFDCGRNAYDTEQALHKHFKEFNVVNENFIKNGATEFFNRDVLNLDT